MLLDDYFSAQTHHVTTQRWGDITTLILTNIWPVVKGKFGEKMNKIEGPQFNCCPLMRRESSCESRPSSSPPPFHIFCCLACFASSFMTDCDRAICQVDYSLATRSGESTNEKICEPLRNNRQWQDIRYWSWKTTTFRGDK
jgi:hypothetical protein